jgi:excisionase family DNA binding protein
MEICEKYFSVLVERVGMVLTVKDMAALLGCSEQAVYKQVSRQALPHRRLGRKVIFLRLEVEAYLNGLPGLQLRHMDL